MQHLYPSNNVPQFGAVSDASTSMTLGQPQHLPPRLHYIVNEQTPFGPVRFAQPYHSPAPSPTPSSVLELSEEDDLSKAEHLTITHTSKYDSRSIYPSLPRMDFSTITTTKDAATLVPPVSVQFPPTPPQHPALPLHHPQPVPVSYSSIVDGSLDAQMPLGPSAYVSSMPSLFSTPHSQLMQESHFSPHQAPSDVGSSAPGSPGVYDLDEFDEDGDLDANGLILSMGADDCVATQAVAGGKMRTKLYKCPQEHCTKV